MTRAVTALLLVALVALAGCGFGGDEAAVQGASLTPPESSWVPGQPPLGAYQEFATVFDRALGLAADRRKAREKALERIQEAKEAARKRADAEARRKYLEAKRRAERLYKLALKRAAEERRRQEEKLRRLREERRRALAEREKKLRVPPGEECRLANVRERFDCKTGRLPDPATDGKQNK